MHRQPARRWRRQRRRDDVSCMCTSVVYLVCVSIHCTYVQTCELTERSERSAEARRNELGAPSSPSTRIAIQKHAPRFSHRCRQHYDIRSTYVRNVLQSTLVLVLTLMLALALASALASASEPSKKRRFLPPVPSPAPCSRTCQSLFVQGG